MRAPHFLYKDCRGQISSAGNSPAVLSVHSTGTSITLVILNLHPGTPITHNTKKYHKMSPATNFHVGPVDLDREEDWDKIFATYWESWKHPLQVTGILTFPWLGEGSARETDSYNSAKAEYLEMARQNPDQHWLKIEDRSVSGSPRIVGGGAYSVVHNAADEGGQHFSAPGAELDHSDSSLPDIRLPGLGYALGSERNVLMRHFYSQMWAWRPRIMEDRPHLCK